MKELAEQINSHMEVIDLDNPTSLVAPEGPKNLEINLALTPPPQLLEELPPSPLASPKILPLKYIIAVIFTFVRLFVVVILFYFIFLVLLYREFKLSCLILWIKQCFGY